MRKHLSAHHYFWKQGASFMGDQLHIVGTLHAKIDPMIMYTSIYENSWLRFHKGFLEGGRGEGAGECNRHMGRTMHPLEFYEILDILMSDSAVLH